MIVMKTLIVIAGMLILCGSCNKSATVAPKNYSGDFVLNSPIDIPLASKMHIRFSDLNFTGAGDSSLLPYIGAGVFKATEDSIYFTQTGAVPAIFGRGSILEGSFLLEQNADSLVFSRKAAAGSITPDLIYRLKRD